MRSLVEASLLMNYLSTHNNEAVKMLRLRCASLSMTIVPN
jgi:hypothetical protein